MSEQNNNEDIKNVDGNGNEIVPITYETFQCKWRGKRGEVCEHRMHFVLRVELKQPYCRNCFMKKILPKMRASDSFEDQQLASELASKLFVIERNQKIKDHFEAEEKQFQSAFLVDENLFVATFRQQWPSVNRLAIGASVAYIQAVPRLASPPRVSHRFLTHK